MKITQEADYSLRIVLYLAQKRSIVDASTLASDEFIPKRFALKILRKLTQAGLTKAYRGINGGYSLLKPADEITLREVIEIVDGPIQINRCLYDKEFCNAFRTNECSVHRVLGEIRENLINDLEKITFKDLQKKQSH